MWNDRRLARRAARGDQDAFAAIFRRYEQDLYRYCVAIVGDRQDAQDALQNTMVKALRALPGERREIELKPWLYRVAHNESIELRRRARPHEPLVEELSAPMASLEETAAERGRLRELLDDIATLSDRHRGALVMRELGGLDFDEIGAALDTTPAAARQVLYEARRGLQQMREGREMRCDAVTLLLSDGDGRVARRRDVRAHLRDCQECQAFAEGMRERSATLAGIAPLPAVAAAAIVKSALAGGGGAAGAAGGTAAGTSGPTLAGGAAVKVASTGAILKSTAAIVAVVGVGAVGVEQGHLFQGGGPTGGESKAAAAVSGAGPDGTSTAKGREPVARVRPTAGFAAPRDSVAVVERTGSRPPSTHVAHASPAPMQAAAESTRPAATPVHQEGAAPPAATEATSTERRSESPAPVAAAPANAEAGSQPKHPEHPAHPENPSQDPHAEGTGSAEKKERPDKADRPEKVERPEKKEKPEKVERPEGSERAEPPAHPTHPVHPSHPTTGANAEAQPTPESDGTESEAEAEPEPESPPEEGASAEVASHPTRPTEPPGQAKK